MLDLIIISGASKGIGESVAFNCSNICKNIIAIGSSDKIFDLNLKNKNCNLLKIKSDIKNYSLTSELIKESINNLGEIKSVGIVLCAAQLGSPGGIMDNDFSSWEEIYSSNVLGNLSIVKSVYNLILNGIKTRIVMFAGGGAAYGYPDFFGYSLTKTANVRAAENLSMEIEKINKNSSVIALAPGAVATDMLAKVLASGASVKTFTDISEPTNFIKKFLNDDIDSLSLNGKFLHVRDDLSLINKQKDQFKLRRIE